MGRGKRILAASLTAVMLTSSFGVTVFAEGEEDAAQITQGDMAAENSEKTEEEIAAEEAAAKQASYDTPADSNSLENWPTGPNVFAASAIVMDMDSGAVLYSKRADEEHYPASITKLLTVLVALENAELTDKVTFTEDCVNFLNWDDANIGMKAGEEITLEDALYGVLLASANEVSYAVAKNVGESMGVGYDGFIEEMNERAQQLGCTDSHWVNANGLHDGQHYTTAHDMAVIASAVYQQDEFCKIEQSLDYTIGKLILLTRSGCSSRIIRCSGRKTIITILMRKPERPDIRIRQRPHLSRWQIMGRCVWRRSYLAIMVWMLTQTHRVCWIIHFLIFKKSFLRMWKHQRLLRVLWIKMHIF